MDTNNHTKYFFKKEHNAFFPKGMSLVIFVSQRLASELEKFISAHSGCSLTRETRHVEGDRNTGVCPKTATISGGPCILLGLIFHIRKRVAERNYPIICFSQVLHFCF